MDWKEVLIPSDFTEWSHDELSHILLHEWGHRMISPVSPHISAIWRKIGQKAGLSEHQAALAVNVVTDAWVDRAYLENPQWGPVFQRGDCESIAGLEERLRKSAQRMEEAAPMEPFMRMWGAFNRRLIRDAGPARIEAHPSFSYTREEQAAADELWQIVYNEAPSEEERVKLASKWLKAWLPEEEQIDVTLYPRFHPFSGREKNAGELTDRVLVRGRRAGLGNADLEELFGEEVIEKMKIRTQRLKMYAEVVPAVEKFLSYRRRKAFEGYKMWRPGGHLASLDIVATVERSAAIIPGVTTLARNFNRRGFHTGRGSGGVILVIDDSGSTDGEVLQREKEAAFAVIAAARQFGDPVGCVVFGSEVTGSIEPTSQYDLLEERLCALDSESGGTAMEPALREALRLTNGHRGFSIMIMTDAEVADGDEVRTVALSFPLESNLVAFCFNTSDAVREGLGTLASRIRLLSASPDIPFVEAALEEIYG
jgi:Mg-chelatase subunit ChlD